MQTPTPSLPGLVSASLYLTIKGYVETRPAISPDSLALGTGCLYIVTFTVSRGALLAVIGSLLMASRRLLKGRASPSYSCWQVWRLDSWNSECSTRLFVRTHSAAEKRRADLRVWPLLIEGFLNSPLIGTGASHAGAITSTGKFISPHNGFLLFAVASGSNSYSFLFCAYCFQSGRAALRTYMSEQQNAVFQLPLVTYVLLITCSGNLDFMAPWAIVSLAAPVAARLGRTH